MAAAAVVGMPLLRLQRQRFLALQLLCLLRRIIPAPVPAAAAMPAGSAVGCDTVARGVRPRCNRRHTATLEAPLAPICVIRVSLPRDRPNIIATCSASTRILIRNIHHNVRVAHCFLSQALVTVQVPWVIMNLSIRVAASDVNIRVTAVEKPELQNAFDRRIGQAQEMVAQRVYNQGQQPHDSGARRHWLGFFAL